MTTKTKKKNLKCWTPIFRVSFPSVHQAKSINNSDPKYSLQMIWPKIFVGDDEEAVENRKLMGLLKQAVLDCAIEKWGPDKAKWPKIRTPFRDGAEKDLEGYGKDVIFAGATSKNRPGVVDQDVNPIVEPGAFYGGCYAQATINPYAYDKAGNVGIAFGLQNVQMVRDGAKFSGKSDPKDDFASLPMPDVREGEGDPNIANGTVPAQSAAEDPLGLNI